MNANFVKLQIVTDVNNKEVNALNAKIIWFYREILVKKLVILDLLI